jgi:hypothetical protein
MDNTKQYLFRLYHEPSSVSHFYTTGTHEGESSRKLFQAEQVYNDVVLSLPDTTTDMIETVNTLVHQEALICVNTGIYFVAVWELSEEKGIDRQTPVAVYFPYGDYKLWPMYVYQGSQEEEQLYTPLNSRHYANKIHDSGLYGFPFWSYELRPNSLEYSTSDTGPDAHMVLCMARQAVQGRCKLQFIKRAVDYLDYFWDWNDRIVIFRNSVLMRLRYPVWLDYIQNLKWQHSGYTIDRDGRAVPRETALSYRVPSGVTSMAAQRKKQARRLESLSWMHYQWFNVVRLIAASCQWYQVHGYTKNRGNSGYNFASGTYRVSGTDLSEMKEALYILSDFINALGFCTGNNRLILQYIPDGEADRIDRAAQIEYDMSTSGVPLNQFAQEDTRATVCIREIISIAHYIQASINQFQRTVSEYDMTPRNFTTPVAEALWYAQRQDIFDSFLPEYSRLQRLLYGILQLLITWQYVFRPIDKGKGKSKTDVLISHKYNMYNARHIRKPYVAKPVISSGPSLRGRFTYDIPQFAPFVFWHQTPIQRVQTPEAYNAYINQLEAARLSEEERQRLQDEAQRLRLTIRSEEATLGALLEYENNEITWQELFATDDINLISNYVAMQREGMAPELREWAQNSVQRLSNAYGEYSEVMRRLNAAQVEGDSTSIDSGIVYGVPSVSLPTVPAINFRVWLRSEREGVSGNFAHVVSADSIESTPDIMSGYVHEYSDVSIWEKRDRTYRYEANMFFSGQYGPNPWLLDRV